MTKAMPRPTRRANLAKLLNGSERFSFSVEGIGDSAETRAYVERAKQLITNLGYKVFGGSYFTPYNSRTPTNYVVNYRRAN